MVLRRVPKRGVWGCKVQWEPFLVARLPINATDGFICTSRQKWEDWNRLVARKGFLLLYHRPLMASLYLCHQAAGYIQEHFAFTG